jgi:modification methylase
MLFHKIIAGNNQRVPAIPTESIHLAITSPPYLKAKDYDIDNPENIGNYDLKEQLEMVKSTYSEVFRVLKPGRKFIVNVPDMVSISPIDNRSCHVPLYYETVKLLQDIGFIYESPFYWCKLHSRSANNQGTWPYPGGVILVHDIEPCAIMRKPGTPDYSHVNKDQREASKMSGEFMKDAMYNTLHVGGETQIKYHIAAFPEELPERFILLYSFVGETVYDPFGGSFTTSFEAKRLERSSIACDIGYKTPDAIPWIEHVKQRLGWLDGSLHGDQILYEVVDPDGKVITSESVEGRGKLEKNVMNEAEVIGRPLEKYQGEVSTEEVIIIPNNDKLKKKKEPEIDQNQQRLF